MKSPRVVVLESDGWLAKQLRELAAECRWVVRSVRSVATARGLVRAGAPAVLLVQFDPADDQPEPLALIGEVYRHRPVVPVVAVADSKLPDGERAAWTAALLDLGARYVLFPPLTRVVLEDVVSGLMTATIGRVVGADATVASPRGTPSPPAVSSAEVIDLAEEDFGP